MPGPWRRYEAFQQHKVGYAPPRLKGREAKLPQGPMQSRLVMATIRAVADGVFIRTNDELTQAVSMEHLANWVADRVRAAASRGEEPFDAEFSEAQEKVPKSKASSGNHSSVISLGILIHFYYNISIRNQ